jgi:hypothetical protein
MLRKSLLAIVAIVLSYGLTALAAYILYAYSDRLSERHMSLLVQFGANWDNGRSFEQRSPNRHFNRGLCAVGDHASRDSIQTQFRVRLGQLALSARLPATRAHCRLPRLALPSQRVEQIRPIGVTSHALTRFGRGVGS